MKAIRIERTGGPEVLDLAEVEVPSPKAGEILVRHEAVGVNFIDTYHRTGLYPVKLPSGLGLEAAGVVEAVGDGVEPTAEGTLCDTGELHGARQTGVAGGVGRTAAPHALLGLDDIGGRSGCDRHDLVGGGRVILRGISHRMSPFISWVGVATRACCSSRSSLRSMSLSSGRCWMSARNLNTASISWSGFGGQPGR